MNRTRCIAVSLVMLAVAPSVSNAGGAAFHSSIARLVLAPARPSKLDASPLAKAARTALAADSESARRAIAELRAAGPVGLDALFDAARDVLARGTADPRWPRTRLALDQVAQQRDAWASHLYWYTDLAAAEAAARASGRPILSLRLLGRLDDELSCANSRFFRTALYANAEVSRRLREHFVLHWSSERPVPRITIDFGDGRVVERTITGNSAHYVLDAQGRPVDVIPGLYGPEMFLAQLAVDEPIARSAGSFAEPERSRELARWHRERAQAMTRAWLAAAGPAAVSAPQMMRLIAPDSTAAPTAIRAGDRAFMKALVERPILTAIDPAAAGMPEAADDSTWQRVSARHRAGARLDASSLALMRRKLAEGGAAACATPGTSAEASDLSARVRTFERGMAEDQVRNEYRLHARVHEWFANGEAPADLAALNARVYAELFLTPRSDAWLGLVPSGGYAALDGDGVRVTPQVEAQAPARERAAPER